VIAFASLFLGFYFGVVNVNLVAAESVTAVRLVLDGRPLPELKARPWKTVVDLGPELAPHELVAVAVDGKGSEIGRVRQWINRPRAEAEAYFVLDAGKGGTGRTARLTWQSAGFDEPVSTVVLFDGQPLVVKDPKRIEIPPYVPERLHFLRAELDFSRGIHAVAEVTFGGSHQDEVLTNLTAVPILVESGGKTPGLDALASAFVKDAAPLHAVALEEGPADVVFVLTEAATLELQRLQSLGRGAPFSSQPQLKKGQSFRFVGAVPHMKNAGVMRLNSFPMSEDITKAPEGIVRVMARGTGFSANAAPLLGNAVGVAAISATARDRRRAVVLLLGAEEDDESPLEVKNVRGFLRYLRVPFFVWSLTTEVTPVAKRWGPVEDVSTNGLFDAAVSSLSKYLDRERIVWVEGTHLPQQIELAAGAKGIRLAQ
jgi:hypothetical protein